ncbi:MAG: DNA mismatch repair endonuclease MutL [Acidobacteriota bacterium]
MAKIRVLPQVLAHQIAAGEIVERPASVVKELLENSIDAAATRIVVEAEDGGRRLLSVSDDGIGMSAEDAQVAFQHHATSKIASLEDLASITTLGFRGEALPSIASVSRLRLRTMERSNGGPAGHEPASKGSPAALPVGTEIQFEGGRMKTASEISWPTGTEIVVEDLFFNVPARRKFLKTAATELGHVSRQVMQYALAYPAVEFSFLNQKRPLFQAPAVSTLEERIHQVMGEASLKNLVPVEFEKEGVRVHGFTSLPHEQRSNGNSQFLYVNGRMVRDRVLTHALRQAYQDLIPSSAYPVAFLFIEIDPHQVDVNVHPSKIEIRFRDSRPVHSAIYHGIEEALVRRKTTLGSLARDIPAYQMQAAAWPESRPEAGAIEQSIQSYLQGRSDYSRRWGGNFASGTVGVQALSGLQPQASGGYPLGGPQASSSDPHRYDIPETADLSTVPVVLGQFVESFIVAADREGVMVIDQHVAHERILYDRALKAMQSEAGCPIQRLLLPLTVELNAHQRSLLEMILEDLNRNGFEVEWFGSSTLVLKGVPVLARDCEVESLIRDTLEAVDSIRSELDSGSAVSRLREKIAISLSCRAAIKINTRLSPEKMQWLLDELFRCESPYTCPHGRPIVLRMNIEDVLRGFRRI